VRALASGPVSQAGRPVARAGHPAAADVPLDVRYAIVSRSGVGATSKRVRLGAGPLLRQIVRTFDRTPEVGGAVTCDLMLAAPPRVAFPATAKTKAVVATMPGCDRIDVVIGGAPGPMLIDREGDSRGELSRLLAEVLGLEHPGPAPVASPN
jgi:hypothetical protein